MSSPTPETVVADRRRLIAELAEVCGQTKLSVDDKMIFRLIELCQRSLMHLSLPERAAMDIITSAFEESARILDNARLADGAQAARDAAAFLAQQGGANA